MNGADARRRPGAWVRSAVVGTALAVLSPLLSLVVIAEVPVDAQEPVLSPYATSVTDDDPVGWWRLGEAAGPDVIDSSGRGRSASFHSSATLGVAGALAGDADLAAGNATGPVFSGNSNGLPAGDADRTVELWFDVTAESGVLFRYGNFLVDLDHGSTLRVGDQGAQVAVPLPHRVVGDRWHHLGVIYDGGSLAVLLDGQLLHDAPVDPLATTLDGDLIVGGAAGAYDEVAVFDQALPPMRLTDRWRTGLTGDELCVATPVDPKTALDREIEADEPSAWWPLGASEHIGMAADAAGCRPAALGSVAPEQVEGGFLGGANGQSLLVEGGWAAWAGSPDEERRSTEVWFALTAGSSPRRKLLQWGEVVVEVVWDDSIEVSAGGRRSKQRLGLPITDGRVHQLVAVLDDTAIDVYVDGARVATLADVGLSGGEPLRLGGTVGRWASAATYPTALAVERVAAHWAAGVATTPPCLGEEAARSGYARSVLESGPLGYWPLGDGAEGESTLSRVALDRAGCRPAQVTGGSPTSGAVVTAVEPTELRGVDGAVVDVPRDVLAGTDAWTVELWAKGGAVVEAGGVEVRMPTGTSRWFSLQELGGDKRQQSITGQEWDGRGWNHVAVSWSSGTWRLVVNGAGTYREASARPSGRAVVVRSGQVDELAVYGRQLAIDELQRRLAIALSASGEVCLPPPSSGHAQAVLATDPVVFWRLDDLARNARARVFQDTAGSCRFLTAEGVATSVNGAVGENAAAELSYGSAEVPLDGLRGDWTVESWVRLPLESDPAEITLDTADQWAGIASDGTILGLSEDRIDTADDTWHHVALVHDAGELRSYVDGEPVGVLAVPEDWGDEGGPATVTVRGPPAGFDELAVHPVALTEVQLAQRVADAARRDSTTSLEAVVVDGTVEAEVVVQVADGPATGEVALFDGETEVATAPLVDGRAELEVTIEDGRDLVARYLGTPDTMASASERVLLGAAAVAQPTVAVLVDGVDGRPGDPAIARVAVSGSDPAGVTPTGFVTIEVDGEALTTRQLDGQGGASFVLARLPQGDHAVRVRYGGDDRYRPSWSDPVNITRPGYVATLTVESEQQGPYSYANPWSSNGRIVAEPGGPELTGDVEVTIDGVVVQSRAVEGTDEWWSLWLRDVAPGERSVQVRYTGDDHYAPVALGARVETFELARAEVFVGQGDDDPTDLVVSLGPDSPAFDLHGTVTVAVDGVVLGEDLEVEPREYWNDTQIYGYGGGVVVPAGSLQPGDHAVTVTFEPANTNKYQTVTRERTLTWKAAPRVTWTVSDPTPAKGQTVTVDVTVDSVVGVPAGSVYLDNQYQGEVDAQGRLSFDLVVDRASYWLDFRPADPETFRRSSTTLELEVDRTLTQTALTASPNPAAVGDNVRIEVEVDGLADPGGFATIVDDEGAEMGTVWVDSGTGYLDVWFEESGNHRFQAVYGGDGMNAPSTSAWIDVLVEPRPSISLEVSPYPPGAGDDVTLTATLGVEGLDAPPVGTVAFYDGDAHLASVDVDDEGVAATTISSITPGRREFRAVFTGDGYSEATATFVVAVGEIEPVLDVTVTAGSVRDSVRVEVEVSAPGSGIEPEGFVTVDLDGEPLGTYHLWEGSVTPFLRLGAGNHRVTVRYGGDLGVAPAVAERTFTVTKDTSTLTATMSPSTLAPGGTLTVDATVGTYYLNPHPAGGVVIAVDGVDRAAVRFDRVEEGYSTWSGTWYPDRSIVRWQGTIDEPGEHTVTVRYEGDDDHLAPTAVTRTVTVGQAATATVGTIDDPIVAGRPVVVPVTVSATSGSEVPTGEVRAYVGSRAVGAQGLVDGTAEVTVVVPAAGAGTLRFQYEGDDRFGPTTVTRDYVADTAAATVTGSAEPSAPAVDQSVQFRAVVAPADEIEGLTAPAGFVTFRSGDRILGTSTVWRGQATVTRYDGFAAGNHQITVSYGGDGIYEPTSSTFELVVGGSLDASFSVDEEEGVAPFEINATADAVEENPSTATYTWKFGDGTTGTGSEVEHTYTTPGSYTLTLTVEHGGRKTFRAQRISVVSPVPAAANAGGDRIAVAGTSFAFDGRGSTPQPGIRTYLWDFGDGGTASGERTTHTYAEAGRYTARLTVWAAFGDPSTDTFTVEVVEPAASGLVVEVASGGQPVAGADVVVIDNIRGQISARTDAGGRAHLFGLADGTQTVYVSALDRQPVAVQATVVDGSGQVLAVLPEGPPGVAVIDSHKMTAAEMAAVGIDPGDPANQGTTSFTIELNQDRRDVYVRPDGTFSPGFECSTYLCAWSYGGGGGGGRSTTTARSTTVDGQPVIQWLTIPGGSRYVKEFFAVDMKVTSLAPAPFAFRGGVATLDLPAGLALASTSSSQSLSVPLGDLGPGATVATTWYLRGDAPGSYDLRATYDAALSPTGTPVRLVAQGTEPLRVYGADAARLVVEAEPSGSADSPYRFRIGVQNLTEGPTYNVTVSLEDGNGYLFQPEQQTTWVWAVVPAGETRWSEEFVALPQVSGGFDEKFSLVRYTAGETDTDKTVREQEFPTETEERVLAPSSQPRDGVFLAWHPTIDPSPISGATTVDRYEVWSTADNSTPFGTKVLDVSPGQGPPAFGGTEIDGYETGMLWARLSSTQVAGDSGYYAIRTVFSDGTASTFHQATTIRRGTRGTVGLDAFVDCGVNGTVVRLEGTNPWGPLARWRIVKLKHGNLGSTPITFPPDEIPAGDPEFEVIASGSFDGDSVARASFVDGNELTSEAFAVAQVTDGGTLQEDGATVTEWSHPEGMLLFPSCFERQEGVPSYSTLGGGCMFGQYVGSAVATSLPGYDPWECRSDPVNTATGALMASKIDAVFPAPGRPTTWQRTYNSNDGRVGMFGLGWSSTYDSALAVDRDRGIARFRSGAGQRLEFELVAGEWAPLANTRATLVEDEAGAFVLTTRDQTAYHFDDRHRLEVIGDRNGRRTELTWTGNDLTSVLDPAGRTFTLTHRPDGRVTGLDLPDGTSIAFGYDGDHLTTVTNTSGQVTTYRYDSKGRMVEETGPTGDRVHLTTYGDDDRVIEQLDPVGAKATFTWDPATETSVMTDAEGGHWIDRYRGNLLIESTDPSGATVSHVYDENVNRIATIDPAGAITAYGYDDRNRMISSARGGPDPEQYEWTYDGDNLVRQVDPNGGVTERAFDDDGNVRAVTLPSGGTFRYTFDEGLVTSITDPLGAVTSYDYDTAGNLLATTDALGDVTSFAYDGTGRVTSVTTPNGSVTTMSYDPSGRPLEVTAPGGATARAAYDGAGRMLTSTAPNGVVTTYERDAAGAVIAVREGDAPPTRFTYDGTGRVETVTDPTGAVTTYERDAAGNPTAVIDPAGHRWTSTYGDAGRLDSRTDPLSNTTTVAYDAAGRPSTVTDPTGAVSSTAWDARGRVASQTDANGETTSFGYDANGNLISITDPTGATERRTYDQANRLVATTSATGARSTLTYDAAGQVTSVVDARGNLAGADPDAFRTTFLYDDDGRQSEVRGPGGETTRFTYDAAGNVATVTDPRGAATTYGYDGARRITSVSDAAGATTAYAYDARGDLVAVTDPKGGVYRSEYDVLHRVIASVGPDGQRSTRTYDARGALASFADPNAHAAGNPELGTTRFTYDARALLTEIDYSRPDTADVSFAYDAAGRASSMTDGAGTETRAYDVGGRLVSIDRNGDETTYGHDAAGRITERTYPGADPVEYSYDPDGRLLSVSQGGDEATYGYDAAGTPASKTWPSGATQALEFDDNGRLERILAETPGGDEVFDATYTYDANGNPTTEDLGSRGRTTHAYDDLNRLTGTCIDVACAEPRAYGYDAATNLLSRTDAAGSTTTTFNASHQALVSLGAASATYTYDANGNVLTDGRRTFTYDQADRLTSITTEDETGAGPGSVPYATTVTDDAPAAYWRFDEEPGATALAPKVGTGNWQLSSSNAATRVKGAVTPDDGARSFEIDDRLTVPDSNALRSSSFTFEAWIDPGTTTGTILRNGTMLFGGWELSRRSDGRLVFTRGLATVTSSTALTSGWHHVAVTVSNTTVRWYIDGVAAGSGTAARDLLSITGGLTFGGAGRFVIDEAAFHTRAVPAAELAARAGTRQSGFAANLTAAGPAMWWRLGDPAGATVVADSSTSRANPATSPVDTRPHLGVASPVEDGSAMSVGASGAHASAPSSAVPVLNQRFSIEAWIRPTASARGLLSTGTGGLPLLGMELRRAADGRLEFVRDSQVVRTASPVTVDAWHHVVVTFDGTTVRLFVDGVVAASVHRGGFFPQLLPMSWTTRGSGYAIDEVAFYTKALSPERVAAHHAAASGGGPVDPVSETVTFSYDGLGNRVEKSAGEEIHRYRWDPQWSVPMLVEDREIGGDVTRVAHGQGPEWLTDANGRHDLVKDRMGSVVSVLDEQGTVEASYEWETYGALRSGVVVGADAPDLLFGWTGEQYDEELALYNLRARVYDPLASRFLQVDPLSTPIGTTWVSPYAYVSGKPTTLVDPTGMRGEKGYWATQRDTCTDQGGNTYYIEPVEGRVGCWDVTECGEGHAAARWACRNQDAILGSLRAIRDLAISAIPGMDCVNLLLGRDDSALTYVGCAMDLIPMVGAVDDLFIAGAKVLDGRPGLKTADKFVGPRGVVDDVIDCATSFSGGTRVLLANGTTKRIDQIVVGDEVLATDPETGDTGARTVTATMPHSDQLLTLRLSSGDVVTTEDHKYWNITDLEWQESQDLDEGDLLLTPEGTAVTVEGLDWTTLHTAPAYDLTVAGYHTFFVTAGYDRVAVHNCDFFEWLNAGPADTVIYLGRRDGETVYVGITNDVVRRQSEHGGRFTIGAIDTTELTRHQARAVEQALINRAKRRGVMLDNEYNSIADSRDLYDQAVQWGEDWLNANGHQALLR